MHLQTQDKQSAQGLLVRSQSLHATLGRDVSVAGCLVQLGSPTSGARTILKVVP